MSVVSQSQPQQPDTLPLMEAATRLGIPEATAYRLANDGEFPVPVLRIGRRFKVSRKALDRLLLGLEGEAS